MLLRRQRLLQRLRPLPPEPLDEHAPETPHERALARALGLDTPAGRTPWAAHTLHRTGAEPGPHAWAWITPCHWQAGMDQVLMQDPAALALDAAHERALFDAMLEDIDLMPTEHQEAARRIRGGQSVTAFPEGTRTRTGELLPFKKGVFVLAQEAGVPVVPVGILGGRAILPRDTWRVAPGDYTVRVGTPLDPEAFPDPEALREAIRRALLGLLEGQEPLQRHP